MARLSGLLNRRTFGLFVLGVAAAGAWAARPYATRADGSLDLPAYLVITAPYVLTVAQAGWLFFPAVRRGFEWMSNRWWGPEPDVSAFSRLAVQDDRSAAQILDVAFGAVKKWDNTAKLIGPQSEHEKVLVANGRTVHLRIMDGEVSPFDDPGEPDTSHLVVRVYGLRTNITRMARALDQINLLFSTIADAMTHSGASFQVSIAFPTVNPFAGQYVRMVSEKSLHSLSAAFTEVVGGNTAEVRIDLNKMVAESGNLLAAIEATKRHTRLGSPLSSAA